MKKLTYNTVDAIDKQITLEEYLEEYLEECTKENEKPVEDDPCKDCTNRTCEWSTCSYSDN